MSDDVQQQNPHCILTTYIQPTSTNKDGAYFCMESIIDATACREYYKNLLLPFIVTGDDKSISVSTTTNNYVQ